MHEICSATTSAAPQATFWNLQCETYYTALMVAFVLEWTWRLRRGDDGWTVETPPVARRVGTYAIFLGLTLLFAAERPVRKVLEPVLPDDIAFSIAHYLRRGLEAPITILFLLVFFDFVLPFRRRDRITPRSPRRSRSAGGSRLHGHEVVVDAVERVGGVGRGDHDVLEPEPEPALEVDAGFDREGVARDQRQVVARARCTGSSCSSTPMP